MHGAVLPSLIKRHSREFGENVDTQRRHANLKRDSRFRKIRFRDTGKRCAKILQCAQDPSGIFCGWLNPDVEIARGPGIHIKVDRVPANDNETGLSVG